MKQKITDALDSINIEEVKEGILDEAMSNFGLDLAFDKESNTDLDDSWFGWFTLKDVKVLKKI